jgi:hypothetical protein
MLSNHTILLNNARRSCPGLLIKWIPRSATILLRIGEQACIGPSANHDPRASGSTTDQLVMEWMISFLSISGDCMQLSLSALSRLKAL